MAEFASRWLDERRAQLSAATAYDYQTILRTHILPSRLSEKPLDAIDDGDIMRLIGELRQKHTRYGGLVSDRRVNMVIARLRTIFATAHRRKLISDDPMKYVDNLREPKPDVDPLTLEEAERLIAGRQARIARSSPFSSSPGFDRTRPWRSVGMMSISIVT